MQRSRLVVRFQDILTHCTSPRESEPLIFHGESGTGKTSLLAKAAAQVAGSGQGKVNALCETQSVKPRTGTVPCANIKLP